MLVICKSENISWLGGEERVNRILTMARIQIALLERIRQREDKILIERRIRYVKTADRVNIASWTVREGMPLVYLTGGPWSHTELWQLPECRLWYGQLGVVNQFFGPNDSRRFSEVVG